MMAGRLDGNEGSASPPLDASRIARLPAIALWCVLALLALLVGFIAWHRRDYLVDDAFIFAQFARNLGQNGEWSFNTGEVVYATTSVFWTLLLVPVEWVSETPRAISAAYAVCVFAASAGTFLAARGLGLLQAGVAATAIAVQPLLWRAAGMETALCAALIVWTAVLTEGRREWLAGMLLGLALLARPDAALLAVALCARCAVERRPLPWKTLLVAGALYCAWLTFSGLYFGTLVPATMQAKLVQRTRGWWGTQPSFLVHTVPGLPLWTISLVALAIAILPERVLKWNANIAPLQAVIGYGVLQAISYQFLDVPAGYFWYGAPLETSACLALVVLASHASRLVARWLERRTSFAPGRVIPAVLFLSLPAFVQGRQIHRILTAPPDYKLAREYQAAADVVRKNSRPTDVVAATEIGYLGYFSERRILDMHALIHPDAHAAIKRDDAFWWARRRPDLIVTHAPIWFPEPKGADGSIAGISLDETARYERIATIPAVGLSDVDSIAVWKRKQ
jgi:hypothetical protein